MYGNASCSRLLFGACALLGAAATAQQADTFTPIPRSDGKAHADAVAGATRLAVEGAGLRGGGAHYAVSLDATGMTFTPALGRAAPRDMPLRLRFDSIRRGGKTVRTAQAAPQHAPTRRDLMATYDRGDGVSERYQVRADGIELSFRFEHPLPGSGDLVVRMSVDTELTARPGDGAHGLRFAAEGLGWVGVGDVTGIDANGARTPGSLRLVGSWLELALPAAFVDSAAYPLVLDPLVGTGRDLGDPIHHDADCDVAYDNSFGVFLAVWERTFSSTNVEIRAQRMNYDGNLVGSFIAVTSGTPLKINPTVACVAESDRFLVAWQEGASSAGPWTLRAAAVDAADGAVSNSIAVSSGTVSSVFPDAAGDTAFGDDEALLVWQEVGGGIRAANVTVPIGHGDPTVLGSVKTVTTNPTDRFPSITKSGGSDRRYVVVWDRQVGSGRDVFARMLSSTATPLGSELAVGNSLSDESHPNVDGDGNQFVVVWQRAESLGASSHDIYCRKVLRNGSNLTMPRLAQKVEADPDDDETDPAIVFIGSKYLVAWVDNNTYPNFAIGLRTLDPDTCTFCGRRYSVTGTQPFNSLPELAAQRSYGETLDRALVVFTSADAAVSTISSVRGQVFEAIGAGGAEVDLAGGCGFGGALSTNGPPAIGNPFFGLTLVGASPAVVTGVLSFNVPAPPLVVCGTCTILDPAITVEMPVINGQGTIYLPVPCLPFLLDRSLEFQVATFGGGVSPCLFTPSFSFSNRLRVTFGS
ncbi:MAG: hypothetical protein R3F56_25080 [Planctomycetota bacterium]